MRTRINGRDSDYQIVTWVDRALDDIVEGVALPVGRMSTDTPSGDLSWEPEVWDASRWREKENEAHRSGRRRLAEGTVNRGGHLVAFTDFGVYVRDPSAAE